MLSSCLFRNEHTNMKSKIETWVMPFKELRRTDWQSLANCCATWPLLYKLYFLLWAVSHCSLDWLTIFLMKSLCTDCLKRGSISDWFPRQKEFWFMEAAARNDKIHKYDWFKRKSPNSFSISPFADPCLHFKVQNCRTFWPLTEVRSRIKYLTGWIPLKY